MYIMFNIEMDDEKNTELLNVFSNKFPRFLELRSGKYQIKDKALVIEAFSILFGI